MVGTRHPAVIGARGIHRVLSGGVEHAIPLVESTAWLEMDAGEHQVVLGQLRLDRLRTVHQLPVQSIRTDERSERAETSVVSEINVTGSLVPALRIRVFCVCQYLHIDEPQRRRICTD